MVGSELPCGRVWTCVRLHASQLGHSWGAELGAKPGEQVQGETLKKPEVTTVQSQNNQAQVHLTFS